MASKHEAGDGKLASGTLEEVGIPSSDRAVNTSSSSASPAMHSFEELSGVHVPHLSTTTKNVMAAWSVSLLCIHCGMAFPVQCLGWMPGFSHASHVPKRVVSGEVACLLLWLLPHLVEPRTTCGLCRASVGALQGLLDATSGLNKNGSRETAFGISPRTSTRGTRQASRGIGRVPWRLHPFGVAMFEEPANPPRLRLWTMQTTGRQMATRKRRFQDRRVPLKAAR